MAKRKSRIEYICQKCGHVEARWFGRCPACQEWNSVVEEVVEDASRSRSRKSRQRDGVQPQRMREISTENLPRLRTGLPEVDRTLGGGLVPGSIVLLGGEPGIGKSTLLIQVMADIAGNYGTALYVTGEESAAQVKMRAERLGLSPEELFLLAETDVQAVLDHMGRLKPFVVVMDSIQSVHREDVPSAPGTVTQVRECTALLLRSAKENGVPVILVGHVTKDGFLAGPRVLEHMVDAVLQMEGERHGSFRLLRALKNRFGSTSEVGLFEMAEQGLMEVANPSAAFLGQNYGRTPGSCVSVSLEGSRPLLLEIQALACPGSGFGAPRRNTAGLDPQRLSMLLAVLEKRYRIQIAGQDVYINIVGGVRVNETAIDLGVCLAVAGSYRNKPLEHHTVAIGEVGLSGEVRPVRGLERRLQEARSLGFSRCLVPEAGLRQLRTANMESIEIIGIKSLGEALDVFQLGS